MATFFNKVAQKCSKPQQEEEKKIKSPNTQLNAEKRLIGQQMITKYLEDDSNLDYATQDQKLYCTLLILEKEVEDRTNKEIQILAKLTEQIKFFKEVRQSEENGPYIHEQLCKNLIQRSFSANKVLFNQGDHGEEFWIVLSGEVKIMKREFVEEKEGGGGNQNKEKESDEEYSPLKGQEKKNLIDEDKPVQGEFQYIEKVRLGPGNCFGELALVSEGETRKATVETTMDSEFAVIMKDDFLKIIKVISQNSVFIEKFASMPIFSQFNYNQIKTLYDICYEKEFRHNNVIYSEGDAPDEIYFIKSGEFSQKILRKDEYNYQLVDQTQDLINILTGANSQNTNDGVNNKQKDLKKNKNVQDKKKEVKKEEQLNMIVNPVQQQPIQNAKNEILQQIQQSKRLLEEKERKLDKATEQHFLIKEEQLLGELMLNRNQKNKKINPTTDHMKSEKFITLKIMSQGECFGEEEILVRKNREYKRVTTIVCESDFGSLYCFSKKDFLKRVGNDDYMLRAFRSQLLFKRQSRSNQLQKFSNTHNSHAKIFDISSNIVRVVRNCDLVEDYEEKEHCFIKPPRVNFRNNTVNQPQQLKSPTAANNTSSDTLSQSGLLNTSNMTQSIRKGQTDDLVIEEIYQNNQDNTNNLQSKIQAKLIDNQNNPAQRQTMKILQSQFDNKKLYLGSIRKSQGIVILQQEYLKQFYEKYNLPEQDLYGESVINIKNRYKLNSSTAQETNTPTNSSQAKAPQDTNSFLFRMNDKMKDLKLNLAENIRQKRVTEDMNSPTIVVNSPRGAKSSDIVPNQQNPLFFPKRMSGFKEFVADLALDSIVEKTVNSDLKKQEYNDEVQQPKQLGGQSTRRRISDRQKTTQNLQSDSLLNSYIVNNNTNSSLNQNIILPHLKHTNQNANEYLNTKGQLSERDVYYGQRKVSCDGSFVSYSEAFMSKDNVKILSEQIQKDYKGQNVTHKDLCHNLIQQNALSNQFKNTFHQQINTFEELTPKGRFFSNSGTSLQSMVKTNNLEKNMRYVNPVKQIHQQYIESSRNQEPSSTLHSKQQKNFHLKNNYSVASKKSFLDQFATSRYSNAPTHPYQNKSEADSSTLISHQPQPRNQLTSTQSKLQFNNRNKTNIDLSNTQNSLTQSAIMNQKDNQSNSGYFNLTDREVHQSNNRKIDCNKLPLKYQLNQIVQQKNKKIVHGKLKQFIPKAESMDNNSFQSKIYLSGQLKNTNNILSEYMPSS